MRTKKAALELSVSTIVVIVIAVSMLILGLVLVRSIMCGAISLTGDINSKVHGEINKLFGATGGEVECIGSGGEPVAIIPGKLNIVYCGVRAKTTAKYTMEITSISGDIKESQVEKWITGEKKWIGDISPGDEMPKKVLRLNVPEDAPESSLLFRISIKRDDQHISTQDLDFEIRRVGLIKSAVC